MVAVHTRSVCHRCDPLSRAGKYFVLRPAKPVQRNFGTRGTTSDMVPAVGLSSCGQSKGTSRSLVSRQWPVGLLIKVAVVMWVTAILLSVFWPVFYGLL